MVSTRTNSERNNREFANRRYYGNSRISCRIEQSIYNRNQIQMVDPGYVDFSDNDVKFGMHYSSNRKTHYTRKILLQYLIIMEK